MKTKIVAFFGGLGIMIVCSCGNQGSKNDLQSAENRIVQQEDGTVSLKLEKAGCYCDLVNPSSNTAEWNFIISKPGRFNVWLSSATKDTSDLRYANSVRISLLDNQFEVNPSCDKIVHNSDDVHYPYFRADSFMGSFDISEPGEYNIQVISEKVISKKLRTENTSMADDTKLMSVILTPITR